MAEDSKIQEAVLAVREGMIRMETKVEHIESRVESNGQQIRGFVDSVQSGFKLEAKVEQLEKELEALKGYLMKVVMFVLLAVLGAVIALVLNK